MINISELAEKVKQEGYSEENAEAKLCQDIVLYLVSKSRFSRNITIKGGVVMRSISNNTRRATQDLDMDLIRYPLTAGGIRSLIKELSGVDGIKIKIVGKIEDLKHQDYNGKRVYVDVEDTFGNYLSSKIDIGVHKYLSLEQIDYCFDIAASLDGVSLLINSPEQMLTEKLKSLLRFGALSTRFKDVYDIYYLFHHISSIKLLDCFKTLIFEDTNMREKNIDDILRRVSLTFKNDTYLQNLNTSNKNWLDVDNGIVLQFIIDSIDDLKNLTTKEIL